MIGKRSEVAHPKERSLVNFKRAGELLGCSEWKVRDLVWSGKLPFVHVGRLHLIELSDLERFIDENKAINRVELHLAG